MTDQIDFFVYIESIDHDNDIELSSQTDYMKKKIVIRYDYQFTENTNNSQVDQKRNPFSL